MKVTSTPAVIHPVVLAVPEAQRRLKGREKVTALRQWARTALRRSAQYSGVSLGPLEKAENGAPLPSKGIHWSLTHKDCYVAAVTASRPIGIDIEKVQPCSQRLYRRLATEQEWALADRVTQTLFYRYWTAKEAVLKAVGIGLAGLTACRIAAIVDDNHLELNYNNTVWRVAHCWTAETHLVTVTDEDTEIEWHQPD